MNPLVQPHNLPEAYAEALDRTDAWADEYRAAELARGQM